MFRIFLLFPLFSVLGDVSRFLDPIQINPHTKNIGESSSPKVSALIAPTFHRNNPNIQSKYLSSNEDIFSFDQTLLEKKISEAILHRYQCDGKVLAKATRFWKPIEISSSFILKIIDCMPEELSSSSFIRFEVWDQGKLVGKFGEPFRFSHVVEVMVVRDQLIRGESPSPSKLATKEIDILRGHAGAVSANSSLEGYQMASNLSIGSPLKWSNLSKVNLIRKGDIVDVFASGGGIFITMKGICLDDGIEGGLVKIRNITSDKEFIAKVLNKSSVKVNL